MLCLGVPVIMAFNVRMDFYNLRDQRDWRQHTWDAYGPVGQTDHWVCIVGYDDAAQRFLVENSWGPGWGDGGFFGLPYSLFKQVYSSACHIDRIYGFHPKPVTGFDTVPRELTTTDYSEFTFGNKENLITILTDALTTQGPQGMINAAKSWAVSDKHFEYLFKLKRGWLRTFKQNNPGFDWEGFVWVNVEYEGMGVFMLNSNDNAAFTTANQPTLTNMLATSLSTGGAQGVIDTAAKWKVSDKLIEYLFGWNRGTVRAFQEANPTLNWSGFLWASL